MSTKIFDCITFYNANFLFKTRFNILKDVVDYFVVCEADKDHVGNSKKYNFSLALGPLGPLGPQVLRGR